MKSKELLLWVIAIFALAMSSFAVLGPKLNLNPLSSDASTIGLTATQASVADFPKIPGFGKCSKVGDIIHCKDENGEYCLQLVSNRQTREVDCKTGKPVVVQAPPQS